MRIYPKNKTRIKFPPMVDGQDAWSINGVMTLTREELLEMDAEYDGYERTCERLKASKAFRRVKELTPCPKEPK
jgi:hypothetical protein